MNFVKFLALALIFTNTSYASSDLVLPGERWIAKSTGYLCKAFEAVQPSPLVHQAQNVVFEKITTDYSLDNGLIKATFEEEGSLCRYSALLHADNDKKTIELVESKAYAVNGLSSCAMGRAMLDDQLRFNDYLYWGHPHHLTIMAPVENIEALCGEGATHLGLDFTVTGKI